MSVRLRVRFPIDDAQLSELHNTAFKTPGTVRPWARQLEHHALTWIGAFHGPDLIGFVQVAWDGGHHAFLLDTAVHPAWQHQRIGAALVEAATTEARKAGCDWLHVDYEPHLTPFYEQTCGFHPTTAALRRLSPIP
ncbi:GNAT family N-acetyltransferase [Paractinoplanes rishiriensis]|uniref:N-acetyltransferase n=1 Tax=Paractinoplanes rishiriensis TaxID=1050105 RepID=A0A919K3P3_9ACTN|nr:GNAT family N-acetyltransferase [Actinoplanes rishiriensis]GIE98702.1 N-acetyltransferase [Actinoplanes rishiriensis]